MKTIKQILLEQLEANKADLKSHNTLKELLIPFNGKPYDKRLQNKLPEGYSIYLHVGLIYINTPTKQQHFCGWINNNETNVVNIDRFDETDSAYFAGSIGRISQLESFLNNADRLKQLTSLFNKVNKYWKAFSNAAKELETSKMESFCNPAYYDLLRNFGVPSEIISDIRFDKIKL